MVAVCANPTGDFEHCYVLRVRVPSNGDEHAAGYVFEGGLSVLYFGTGSLAALLHRRNPDWSLY